LSQKEVAKLMKELQKKYVQKTITYFDVFDNILHTETKQKMNYTLMKKELNAAR